MFYLQSNDSLHFIYDLMVFFLFKKFNTIACFHLI